MGSHVHLRPGKPHKHVTVRLLLHASCQPIGRRFCFLHSALSHLLLCQTTINTVCEYETHNAVCRVTLLLEPCVLLINPAMDAEKTHICLHVCLQ